MYAAGTTTTAATVVSFTSPLGKRKLSFAKYEGVGNDFILISNLEFNEPLVNAALAVTMCNRHRGIGADGVIMLMAAGSIPCSRSSSKGTTSTDRNDECHYTMKIINSDGSEPEMCGNGIRCLAKFIKDLALPVPLGIDEPLKISTLAGPKYIWFCSDGNIQVDMGQPKLRSHEIPTNIKPSQEGGDNFETVLDYPIEVNGRSFRCTCVSMGNPHTIIFCDDKEDIRSLCSTFGVLIEENLSLFPEKTNVEFVQILPGTSHRMKVCIWERGCGFTQACGTGACAAVVAAKLLDKFTSSNIDETTGSISSSAIKAKEVVVTLPGGDLRIGWEPGQAAQGVMMTGPAAFVFRGEIEI